jgi:hypothetical protein
MMKQGWREPIFRMMIRVNEVKSMNAEMTTQAAMPIQ